MQACFQVRVEVGSLGVGLLGLSRRVYRGLRLYTHENERKPMPQTSAIPAAKKSPKAMDQ